MDDDASSTTAFFYGTLMSAAVLRRVIFGQKLPNSTTNRHLPAPRPALLQDYQRHRVSGADYPAVIPQNGSCVRGTVVTGLTEGDWWRLDLFEGEDYRRDVVKVLVKKQLSTDQGSENHTWESLDEEDLESQGEEILVQTYIWKSSDTLLEPLEWDFDEFIREKLWRWAGEEADNEGEYEDLDGAVAVAEDAAIDPTGGRNLNGGIITDNLNSASVSEEQIRSAV